jgi:hypothetical protein
MQERDDEGAVLVLVALLMTALLTAGALVLDIGNQVAAARQAQNSADAAVLSRAMDCAKSVATGSLSTYLATGVQLDPVGTIPSCGSGTVTVKTQKTVMYGLARVIGKTSGTVHRQATAKWGQINSANTVPVVISSCTFNDGTAGGTVFPSSSEIIPLGGGGPTCPGGPPGGFGWLDLGSSGDPCSVPTTLDATGAIIAHGNSGNGTVNPWDCITQVGVGGTILIPVYTSDCKTASDCVVDGVDAGRGSNNYYRITGFAEIKLEGWNLQHGSPTKAGSVPTCPGPGSVSCIQGTFIKFTTQVGSTGPGTNFGVTGVSLVS